jgi:hypothetical protein
MKDIIDGVYVHNNDNMVLLRSKHEIRYLSSLKFPIMNWGKKNNNEKRKKNKKITHPTYHINSSVRSTIYRMSKHIRCRIVFIFSHVITL